MPTYVCEPDHPLSIINIIDLLFNEPVFLVSEFSLRYLLILEDQILVLDFSSGYQKKNSQMRL